MICFSASASAAASRSHAGGLRAGRSVALRTASRTVEASDQSPLSLRRATQNHVHELLCRTPRISWRSTSTGPRGVTTVTISGPIANCAASHFAREPSRSRSTRRSPAPEMGCAGRGAAVRHDGRGDRRRGHRSWRRHPQPDAGAGSADRDAVSPRPGPGATRVAHLGLPRPRRLIAVPGLTLRRHRCGGLRRGG
jgi:hypothetical protein